MVWTGTLRGGVSRFEGPEWETWTTEEGLAADMIRAVPVGEDDATWAATRKGVSRFDGSPGGGCGEDCVGAVAATARGWSHRPVEPRAARGPSAIRSPSPGRAGHVHCYWQPVGQGIGP